MAQHPVEMGLIAALTLRGLFIGDYEKLRQAAQEAERVGFGSLWHCDHFITLDPGAYGATSGFGRQESKAGPRSASLLEAWTALAALSRDTKTLRLGTLVTCVHNRPPSMLGKIAATLDVISGGRLDFGIGAGWIGSEYKAFGFDFPKASVRIAQLEEAIQLIRAMWTQEHPVFSGGYYQIDGAICDPPPVQKPHPPIWTGGEGEKLLAVAARQADGYNCRWWSPERFQERRPAIEAEARRAGRDPAELRASVMLMLIPEKDRAVAQAAREKLRVVPDSGTVAGTPDECLRRLKAYVAVGVRHLLVTIPDLDENPHRLRLAGEEILPALREL